MDNQLSYNCRLALTKQGYKTSNDTGSYRPPYYFSYEKKERGRIPNVEVNKPFAMSDTYSSTYNTSYLAKTAERDLTNLMSKYRFFYTEYPKLRSAMPAKYADTEYREQYLEKDIPKCVRGISVEQQTTCPMALVGRDEREPVPLTRNIGKYLDIYVSTARQDFRPYSEQEQRGIATKEVITSQETMEIPKGRGFGMRTPALAGQDLERRDKNMTDKVFSSKEFKLRNAHIPLPWVPPHGMTTEYASAFTEPVGTAKRHAFDSFVEYPDRNTTSVIQAVCPPGMFSTEYDTINKHTTPQAVV